MKTVLLAFAVLLTAGCAVSLQDAPLADTRPTLCEYVRQAVKTGSMPLEIAKASYPECYATDGGL